MRTAFVTIILLCVSLNLLAEEPVEALVWDLEDFVSDDGKSWTTASFPTLPGALYTLTSGPVLESWTAVNSFYALGNQLHLALFENNPTPVEFEEELVGEPVEQQPAQVASLQLRPLASGSGTAAIWRSLEPDLDGAIIRRVLSSSLVDAWEGASVRFDTLDHFFTFSSALVHSPVSADFQETPPTEFGDLDADFFASSAESVGETSLNSFRWRAFP